MLKTHSIAFAERDESQERSTKAVEKIFSPEFRNRLTATVHFKPLDKTAFRGIARKFVNILSSELIAKDIALEATDAALDHFAEHGFDSELGARPLERLIRRETAEKLADEILFGKLTKGGNVLADISEDKKSIVLKITSSKKTRADK